MVDGAVAVADGAVAVADGAVAEVDMPVGHRAVAVVAPLIANEAIPLSL